MTEHRYTLAEIDRMRAALWRKYNPPRKIHDFELEDRAHFPERPSREEREAMLFPVIEDQLRTYLLAGIRPEELECAT